MKARLNYIDSLKGFAIICVVIGHVVNGYTKAGLLSQYDSILNGLYYAVENFHMPLFMILSGFVFCKAYSVDGRLDYRRIKIQIANCLWVYLLFSVVWIAFKVLLSSQVNNSVQKDYFLFFPIRPVDHYWYIFVLSLFYLLFMLLWPFRRRVVFVMVIIGINFVSGYIPWIEWFSLNRVMYYMLFFFVGTVLSGSFQENNNCLLNNHKIICIFGIAGIIVAIIYEREGIAANTVPIVNTIVGLSISLAFFDLAKLFQEKTFLSYIGMHSLDIYLLHGYFTAGTRIILTRVFPELGIINVFIGIILSTLFPILIAIAMKQMGIYRIFFKPVTCFNLLTGKITGTQKK